MAPSTQTGSGAVNRGPWTVDRKGRRSLGPRHQCFSGIPFHADSTRVTPPVMRPATGPASPTSGGASGGGTGGQERPGVRWSGRGTPRQDGFTLAAVVVIMAVMAILLTVAVETVSFQQRREKEEELIFRGNQVVEAIRLFRARNGRFPLNLVELVTAKPRVLRKTWVDPMTGLPDWEPVFLGEEGVAVTGPGLAATPTPAPARGPGPPHAAKSGAIIGVHSRSCEEAIKLYDGRSRHCEWKFYFDPNKKVGPQPPGPAPTPRR